jgi:hypothetical protein
MNSNFERTAILFAFGFDNNLESRKAYYSKDSMVLYPLCLAIACCHDVLRCLARVTLIGSRQDG